MNPPLGVALVGYGLGGSVFHAPLIDSTEGMALEAVVTSTRERAEAVRRRYPRTRVVAGVEDLLERSPGIDVVVVSVPNAHHFDVAAAALRSGRTTVVDKPVTPTSAQARRLAAIAGESGVSVIPYHNRRWDGDYLTVADLAGSGRLGRIWRFESRFERWRPAAPSTPTWKQDPSQAGGGILFDLGTHLVDQALHLFGRPVSVYAETAGHTGPLDDDAFVALRYPDGPAVHLWASSTAASLGPRFRVLGSEAAYVKWGMDPQEEALRAGGTPGDPGWGADSADRWGRLGTVEEAETLATRTGSYQDFYAGVVAHLRDGAAPPVDIADAVTGLEVLEAAVVSARSGSAVPLA